MRVSVMIDRVYQALASTGVDCSMEDVPALCPDLTWNQIFLAVDYLSRTGDVHVTPDAGRTYRVRACPRHLPDARVGEPGLLGCLTGA